jgi:hypothetical protein
MKGLSIAETLNIRPPDRPLFATTTKLFRQTANNRRCLSGTLLAIGRRHPAPKLGRRTQ